MTGGDPGIDLGRGRADDPVARRLPADVEQQRAGERLERRGQDRRPLRPDPRRLAFAEQQEAARDRGARPARPGPSALTMAARRADRMPSSSSGWRAYRASEMARLTTASPRNSSRSLWPGGLAGVLVQPGGVGQRLGQEAPIPDRQAELLGEEVRPVHDPDRARGPGVRGRARCFARRCTRRRRRPSGSAPRPRRRSPSRTPPRGS